MQCSCAGGWGKPEARSEAERQAMRAERAVERLACNSRPDAACYHHLRSERGEHREHCLRVFTPAGNKSSGCRAALLIFCS